MELIQAGHILMAVLFFVVAVIYSSVGHAGASGYSAIMALFSVSPVLMRPTALTLNLVVGSIGLYRYYRARLVNLKVVVPFLIGSIPATYLAAQLNIEKKYFYLALGIVLTFSGIKLLFSKSTKESNHDIRKASLPISIFVGGLIGILSGITGTGGAIFFTPLLLQMKWAEPKNAAGLSVVFVLTNSVFGLAGIFSSSVFFDIQLTIIWGLAVILGAIVGTQFGIFKFSNLKIQKMLGVVMLIASIKLISFAFKS